MALYVRWNDKWNMIGGAAGGEAVFKVGPRGNSVNGFVDNITHENLSGINFNIPIEGSTRYLFANNNNLEKVPDYYNFKRSTDAVAMFYNASKLVEFNNFDMNFAINVSSMFYSCQNLEEVVDLELGRANRMFQFFYNSRNLKTVRLLNLEEVVRVNNMLVNCFNLTSLELFGLGARNQTNLTYRTLDVTSTNLNTDGMNKLAHSLGTSNTSNRWVLRYKRNVNFDTSIMLSKGWVLDPR